MRLIDPAHIATLLGMFQELEERPGLAVLIHSFGQLLLIITVVGIRFCKVGDRH